ncbi:hypothetical protein ALC56_09484 [Trachymyrmex septentrionalis]|uniref:Uncharacterized protein n=1 Tax=Trachymyrmex septentrionalis TaxID=34720 RepID=A0A151JUI5_9HYME|nr:hypothetical protein ALC56_09484 [Trachymyrmex septentrionalis]
MRILEKENIQLTASLFDTMDADDAQRINEQLQILQDNQQVLESDLDRCIRDTTTYTCAQTFPIYYIKSDASCELIFINAPGQLQNCENRHVFSSTTL